MSLAKNVAIVSIFTLFLSAYCWSDDKSVQLVKARPAKLGIKSSTAIVYDQLTGRVLFSKNVQQISSIASITKLMTAMVILDSGLPLLEPIKITKADIDRYKLSKSKLRVGSVLMRAEMLKLALMASENRAASALARTFPGGTKTFVAEMNRKALRLGMKNSRFVDSTGLRPGNVSTAADLVKLVAMAHSYPMIRKYTTAGSFKVEPVRGHRTNSLQYVNTNRLVKSPRWDIGLSKTGYIREAGRCLVMQAKIVERPLIIILLDSWGKLTRIGDANRIRRWIESDFSRLRVSG